LKFSIPTILLVLYSNVTFSQRPKDGIYTYSIAFAEWGGRTLGSTCLVKIKGDSIYVIHNGNKSVSGKKGDIFDSGIIMKHTKTGKWIIGHNKKDVNAKEIGGCSDGPTIIDFKRKIWWNC
jgi:hypothetical protein